MMEVLSLAPVEPVSLQDAKAWLRVEHAHEDELVAALITAAREYAEERTGGLWAERTVVQYYERFCACMYLPRPPCLVRKVEYRDVAGTWIEVPETVYSKDIAPAYGCVFQRADQTWPTPSSLWRHPIRITYTAGCGEVPEKVKQAMRLLIALWYENREDMQINETNNPRVRSANVLLDGYREVAV